MTFLYVLENPTVTIYATPNVPIYGPQLYQDLKNNAQKALAQAQRLADEAYIPAHTSLIEHQDPVEAIHNAEKTHDMVVMGTHGRRGFNRAVFGSVAEGALRRAQKPYLMIRHTED